MELKFVPHIGIAIGCQQIALARGQGFGATLGNIGWCQRCAERFQSQHNLVGEMRQNGCIPVRHQRQKAAKGVQRQTVKPNRGQRRGQFRAGHPQCTLRTPHLQTKGRFDCAVKAVFSGGGGDRLNVARQAVYCYARRHTPLCRIPAQPSCGETRQCPRLWRVVDGVTYHSVRPWLFPCTLSPVCDIPLTCDKACDLPSHTGARL